MIKKHIKLITIFTIIAFVGISIVFVSATLSTNDKWSLWGRELFNLKQIDRIDTNVLAIVGNTEITEYDLKVALTNQKHVKRIQQANLAKDNLSASIELPKLLSEEEMLEKLIIDELLYQEAIKQNLEISLEKAKNYHEETQRQIDEVINGKADVDPQTKREFIEHREQHERYLESLGMSIREYHEELILAYQKLLSIGNLRQKVISSLTPEEQMNHDIVNAHFESFKKNLRNTKEVHIINQ